MPDFGDDNDDDDVDDDDEVDDLPGKSMNEVGGYPFSCSLNDSFRSFRFGRKRVSKSASTMLQCIQRSVRS